jgi:uncharacterized protein
MIFNTMKQLLSTLLIVLAFSTLAQKPRRLEVLFLGDSGHHNPMARYAQIASALGTKGINFSYTDQLADINDDNLAKYDAILVYANHDAISKQAERSLLNFVAAGKGLLPIHCASYCFRNSPEYIKMVGGQFWKHGTDTVTTINVQPYSPLLRGVGNIRSHDETYLHDNLQPDNTVLQVRPIHPDQAIHKPSQKTEPYTWTRKYGQGNVFYTAYGHDDATWANTAFQQMIYNALLYVVPEAASAALKALDIKPFEYKDAQLPNYEKREGPQRQQLPLSPAESMKLIQIPPDFDLSLYAAEPNVQHPIAMAWDERGRMYVLITKDYPNERKDSGGSDFILICEDTNADGQADKFTKFAEGLSIPTGLVFADGGLVVSQAPHMLYLKDTDGDDRADVKKILFSGFGTGDTHAGPSSLIYGLDNWIWGSVGYSGFEGKVGNGPQLKFGQAFFRFKTGINDPNGPQLEWMTSTSNNTWGLGINEAGDIFGSTANNAHGWYMAIPHSHYQNPSYNTDNGSRSTDTHKDMKTITQKIRQVDVFGGFTAAAGHHFYTARAFPKNYWNQIAFVAEPTGHVLHQNNMVKTGSNYNDKEAFNLMAGADEWFSPVFAQVGPDGAVWVADWYSFIIQHNPKPEGFAMGKGNAYETDLRDYTHGRIYRVAYKQAPEYKPINLQNATAQELANTLHHPNMLWRSHAQRLLVERGLTDVSPTLLDLIKNPKTDEIGLNCSAIHALWVLQGLNITSQPQVLATIKQALKHPSWAVRKNALQVMPNTAQTATTILEQNLLADTEPLVVLNAILKLNQCPSSPAVNSAILARMEAATEATDRWLPEAFATALTSHEAVLLKIYLQKLSLLPASKNNSSQAHNHAAMGHTNSAKNTPNTASNTKATAQKGIDLQITGIRYDNSQPSAKETTKYYVEVTNQGLDSLPNGKAATLRIHITGQGQHITTLSHTHNTGIAPGQTVTIARNTNGPWSGDLSFTTDSPGLYTFNATVDYEQKVAEYNEKNNTYSSQLVVSQVQSLALLALERACRSYALALPPDSLIALLQNIPKLDQASSSSLLKGLAAGSRKGSISAKNEVFVKKLANITTGSNKDNLAKLMQNWGIASSNNLPKPATITIKTVVEAMKYDLKEFTVKAGSQIILNIENPDAMQHNLVIGKPNSLTIIGKAADKMITQANAADKNYVPDIPQVLAASPLINAGASYQLLLTVPNQPGSYPFVCTFPGHWRLMNGIMKVTK